SSWAGGRADEEAAERVVERARDAYETARARMVEEQLVRREVTDERVLSAMRRVERHLFVEEALRDRAYGDHPLPIGEEQTISQPYIVGFMTQLLELHDHEKVLEVGTGSGYQTAVLAELARRVCSIERLPRLAERARALLERLGYDNVWVRVGSGTLGWPDEAPFDRILVTAGGPPVAGRTTEIRATTGEHIEIGRRDHRRGPGPGRRLSQLRAASRLESRPGRIRHEPQGWAGARARRGSTPGHRGVHPRAR